MTRRALLHALALAMALACGVRSEPAAPAVPQRIASQTVLSDEVLWALGPEVHARVIGVSALVDDERYSSVAGEWPASVPRLPQTSEEIVAVRPDLAIVAEFTAIETRSMLDHAGIATLVLAGFGGLDDVRRHVRAIADAVGAAERGEALVADFDAELARLRSTSETRPTVVAWHEGVVAGTGTMFDDEAGAAGFVNLAAQAGVEGHHAVALEQVVAWDPQWLVVSCGASDCAAVEREMAARPGLSATTAAREGRIVALPARLLYATGLGTLEVVRLLRQAQGEP